MQFKWILEKKSVYQFFQIMDLVKCGKKYQLINNKKGKK